MTYNHSVGIHIIDIQLSLLPCALAEYRDLCFQQSLWVQRDLFVTKFKTEILNKDVKTNNIFS